MDLQIESRNVDMTPRWKTEIEQRMESLQVRHGDLIHGRVTLTKNRHHKKDACVAEALVLVTLPGRNTITARKEDKTFEESIRAAFSAVENELQKYRDKRGATEVRTEPIPPLRGVISKLFPEEGYGFILQEGGGEVYFHKNALRELDFQDLSDGIEVVFNAAPGEKGEHATVVLAPPGHWWSGVKHVARPMEEYKAEGAGRLRKEGTDVGSVNFSLSQGGNHEETGNQSVPHSSGDGCSGVAGRHAVFPRTGGRARDENRSHHEGQGIPHQRAYTSRRTDGHRAPE